MPNDTQHNSSSANPSFSLGLAPTCLGVISLSNGSGDTARRWRLHQPKCTIGSDRQATVWIDDSKVAAIHALIVFGSHQTIIKTFGPGLKINGQTVQESLLQVGDRIELAGYSFLIESLHSGAVATKLRPASPKEPNAFNPAEPSQPNSLADETNFQFYHLEKRVDELLEGLKTIDSKISRSSTEQKEDFVRQCDTLRNETEHLRRGILEDFSSQLRNFTDDLQRQSDQRESRFETRIQDLYSNFSELRLSLDSKLEEMQRRSDKRLEQLEQEAAHLASQSSLSASSADFAELQSRINNHIETINYNFQELRADFESQLAQLYRRTEEKIVRLEDHAARVTAESTNTATIAKQADDTQTELEALQSRLSQLESVLADITANAANQTERGSTSQPDQLPVYPTEVEFRTAPNPPITESFRRDNTTPYLSQNTKSAEINEPSTPDDRLPTETTSAIESRSQSVAEDTFATASPFPSWQLTDSPVVADSPVVIDDEWKAGDPVPVPYGNWPFQASNASAQPSDESDVFANYPYNEFPSALPEETNRGSYAYDPISSDEGQNLNTPEAVNTDSPSSTIPTVQPLFNQSDWEESDTYLKTERASSVTALDILRASYSSESRDTSADDLEESWADGNSSDRRNNGSSYMERSYASKDSLDESAQAQGMRDKSTGNDSYEEVETIVETVSPYGSSRLGGSSSNRSKSSAPASPSHSEEESVEAYMQKLLARMRGEDPGSESSASNMTSLPSKTVGNNKSSNSKAVRNTYSPLRKTRQDPAAALIAGRTKVNDDADALMGLDDPENSDENGDLGYGDNTMPRSAPERTANFAALRELANDSARTAISSSDKKPKPLGYTIKLAVSVFSGCVGGVLMYNNGMQVNMTLIAATAAFMLSAIWGLDVLQMGMANPKPEKPANSGNQVQMKISGRK